MDTSVAEIDLAQKDDGRFTVTVAHARLASSADVEPWKEFWSESLAALDERRP